MTRGGVTADFRSLFASRCAARAVSSTLDQDVENDAVLIDASAKTSSGSRAIEMTTWRVARGNLTPTRSQKPYVNSLKSYGSRCVPFACRKRQWAKR